jgi:hypothetical protein
VFDAIIEQISGVDTGFQGFFCFQHLLKTLKLLTRLLPSRLKIFFFFLNHADFGDKRGTICNAAKGGGVAMTTIRTIN